MEKIYVSCLLAAAVFVARLHNVLPLGLFLGLVLVLGGSLVVAWVPRPAVWEVVVLRASETQ